jgi:hypothetical protein
MSEHVGREAKSFDQYLPRDARHSASWAVRRPSPDSYWMWQHLVEEYARHNGHADLIREVIDGSAGL